MKSACTLSPRADVGHVSIVLLKKLSDFLTNRKYAVSSIMLALFLWKNSRPKRSFNFIGLTNCNFYQSPRADVGHVSIVLVKNSWPMRSFNSIKSINGKFYQSRRADVSHVSIVLVKKTQLEASISLDRLIVNVL